MCVWIGCKQREKHGQKRLLRRIQTKNRLEARKSKVLELICMLCILPSAKQTRMAIYEVTNFCWIRCMSALFDFRHVYVRTPLNKEHILKRSEWRSQLCTWENWLSEARDIAKVFYFEIIGASRFFWTVAIYEVSLVVCDWPCHRINLMLKSLTIQIVIILTVEYLKSAINHHFI